MVAKIGAGRSTANLTTVDRLKTAALTNIYLQKYTHEHLAYPLALVLSLIVSVSISLPCAQEGVHFFPVSGIRAKFIREK